MKYGVAVWNYLAPDVRLCDLVKEMSSFGFDAVSFLPDQILELDDTGTEIDSMIVPMREMGERAVEKLSEKIKHPERAMAPEILPMKYLKGITCAPPGSTDNTHGS